MAGSHTLVTADKTVSLQKHGGRPRVPCSSTNTKAKPPHTSGSILALFCGGLWILFFTAFFPTEKCMKASFKIQCNYFKYQKQLPTIVTEIVLDLWDHMNSFNKQCFFSFLFQKLNVKNSDNNKLRFPEGDHLLELLSLCTSVTGTSVPGQWSQWCNMFINHLWFIFNFL